MKEDFHELKRINNFWNNNYIEYESNCDKNRYLSLVNILIKSTENYLKIA